MSAFSLVQWWSDSAQTLMPLLLDMAAKSVVILAVTALATVAMRRASAAARHLVWVLGAGSLLILPILSAALPGWHILPRWTAGAAAPTAENAAPIVPPSPTAARLPPREVNRVDEVPQEVETVAGAAPPAMPAAAAAASPVTAAVRLKWQGWVLLAWAAGSVVLAGRIACGFLSLWWLERGCMHAEREGAKSTKTDAKEAGKEDGEWAEVVEALRERLGIGRPVRLLRSGRRSMPMTWGIWRTRVLLPTESSGWTTEQRRAVLLHELAHAKRWDCLSQLIVQTACALYWLNPLAWVAWHRVQIERERACDDLVLSTGTKASSYAQQLLQIASSMPAVAYSAAAIAMARPGSLEARLKAILDVTRNRRALTGIAVATCLVAFLAALIPVASLRPAGLGIASGQPAGDASDIRLLGVIPDGGDDVMSADGQKLGDELAAFTLSPDSNAYWGPFERRRDFIFELPPSLEAIALTFTGLRVAGENHGLSYGQHPLLLESNGRRYLSLSMTFPRTWRTQLVGMISRDKPFDAIDLSLRYFVGAPGKADFSVKGPLKLGEPLLADAATQTTVTLTKDQPIYSAFHLSSKKGFDGHVIAYDKQQRRHLITMRNGGSGSSGTEMEYNLGELSPSEITLLTFGETPRERVFQNIKVSYANRPATDYAPYLDQMARRLGITGLPGEQLAGYSLSGKRDESLAVVDVVRGLHLYHAVNSLYGTDISKATAEDQARTRTAANRLVQSPFSQVRGLALQLGLQGAWPEFIDPAIDFLRSSDRERGAVAHALSSCARKLNAQQIGKIRDILVSTEDRMILPSLWYALRLRRDEPPIIDALTVFAKSPQPWLWWPALQQLSGSEAGRRQLEQMARPSPEMTRRILLVSDGSMVPGASAADLKDASTLLPSLLTPALQRVDLGVFHDALLAAVEHRDQASNTALFVNYLEQLIAEWDLSRVSGMADDNWWAVDRMVKYLNLWHGVNIGSLGSDVNTETRGDHDWRAIAAEAIRWRAGSTPASSMPAATKPANPSIGFGSVHEVTLNDPRSDKAAALNFDTGETFALPAGTYQAGYQKWLDASNASVIALMDAEGTILAAIRGTKCRLETTEPEEWDGMTPAQAVARTAKFPSPGDMGSGMSIFPSLPRTGVFVTPTGTVGVVQIIEANGVSGKTSPLELLEGQYPMTLKLRYKVVQSAPMTTRPNATQADAPADELAAAHAWFSKAVRHNESAAAANITARADALRPYVKIVREHPDTPWALAAL